MTTRNIHDGLMNVASGLGTREDKSTYATYAFAVTDFREIEAAYQTSGWFRKIVEIPVNDSMREGIDWQAEAEEIEQLEKEVKRLGFWEKFKKARTWARRDGGAVIVMGLPGNPESPVNFDTIKAGDLKVLTVLSRHEITPSDQINVILDPNYGQAGAYVLKNGTRIHPSRVLRFIGLERSPSLGWDGWGDSIYPAMSRDIKNADRTSAAIAHLMEEAKVDIIGIPGLTENFTTEQYEGILMRRIITAQMLKSLVHTLVIDTGDGTADSPAETYEQKQINFSGLPEVLQAQLMVLSGVSDIPATRLVGKAPDGMNATGDGDLRNYYDNIASQQKNELSPILDPFFEILIRSVFGSRDDRVWYTWSPLYTLTEKEYAEIESTFADIFTKYANNGLIATEILTEAAQTRMVESGQYPGLEDAIAKNKNVTPPALEEPTAEEIALAQSGTRPANNNAPARRRVAANDARPKTLYISRPVVNAGDIIAWAQTQGITGLLPGAELHVTIAYSRQPVDWMKVGAAWESEMKIPAGGPRMIDKFGEGAIVLLIAAPELEWRHRSVILEGGTHDYPEYQPHITVGFTSEWNFDPDKYEPYQGEIILGPERFEEVKEWSYFNKEAAE